MTRAHEITEAQVICLNCKQATWVAYEDRYAGRKQQVKGMSQHTYARCQSCPSGSNYTEWRGMIRVKEE